MLWQVDPPHRFSTLVLLSPAVRGNRPMHIEQSLTLVLDAKRPFGDTFYRNFFENYPEVRPYFERVNLERQSILLTMALMVIQRQYDQPFQAAEAYLKYLGTRHCDRGIPKALYPLWKANLLATLEEFHGDQWSDSLERQWIDAVDQVTEIMFDGYAERFTV